jgi:streptogramin lyase
VYISGTGGGGNNNLLLMAALGPCGNLTSSTFININEVTTVAAIWALAPFMSSPTAIGAPSTNALGLANAVNDVSLLVNTSTGTTPGPRATAGVSVPAAEIYTLANILAACVNSSGGVAGDGQPCGTLFGATKVNGIAPTDTVTAALNIATHPAANVVTLFNLAPPSSPFQPMLVTPPNDLSIAVTFSGASLNAPSALAVDATGNVWIANRVGGTLTELSSTGTVLSGNGYKNLLNNPSSVAIATDGSIWVTNKGNDTVSRFTAAGAPYTTPYSGGNMSAPNSIALDSVGTAWVANSGNGSVTAISNSGTMANYNLGGAPLSLGTTPH